MVTDAEIYISIAYTLLETITAESNAVRLRLLKNGSSILSVVVTNNDPMYIQTGRWGLIATYVNHGS